LLKELKKKSNLVVIVMITAAAAVVVNLGDKKNQKGYFLKKRPSQIGASFLDFLSKFQPNKIIIIILSIAKCYFISFFL
jgi:hypothetical protein